MKQKAPELRSYAEWLEEDLGDPRFRDVWDASVLARAISHAVTRYRSEHGLTQTALGELLGMSQTQISRIEVGEHTPNFETLLRLTAVLDLEVSLTIGPKVKPRREIPKALRRGVCDATDQVVVSVRPSR